MKESRMTPTKIANIDRTTLALKMNLNTQRAKTFHWKHPKIKDKEAKVMDVWQTRRSRNQTMTSLLMLAQSSTLKSWAKRRNKKPQVESLMPLVASSAQYLVAVASRGAAAWPKRKRRRTWRDIIEAEVNKSEFKEIKCLVLINYILIKILF